MGVAGREEAGVLSREEGLEPTGDISALICKKDPTSGPSSGTLSGDGGAVILRLFLWSDL